MKLCNHKDTKAPKIRNGILLVSSCLGGSLCSSGATSGYLEVSNKFVLKILSILSIPSKKAWTGLQDGRDIETLVATRYEIATSRAFVLVGNKDGLLLALTGAPEKHGRVDWIWSKS